MFELRDRLAGAGRRTATLTLAALVLVPATAGAARVDVPGTAGVGDGAGPVQIAGALTGCAASTAIPSQPAMRKAAADAVLCLINVERARRGLARVVASPQLGKAANSHSSDMVRRGYFSHVTPSGLNLRKRVARTGYLRGARRGTLGETIAWGADLYASPVELVASLMQSAGHKAIIVDRRFRDIGVGLALGAPLQDMGSSATLSLTFGRR